MEPYFEFYYRQIVAGVIIAVVASVIYFIALLF